MTKTGVFGKRHADRKNWKVDEGLIRAIEATIPRGASVVDVGAGYGHYVKWLREHGYPESVGVDGIEGAYESTLGLVHEADLTTANVFPSFTHPREWSICIEVGEHIPAEHSANFIENLSRSATHGLIVSWAAPGQRGRDHINCRMPEWVANMLGGEDWWLDDRMTEIARKTAGKGWDHKLMVFKF